MRMRDGGGSGRARVRERSPPGVDVNDISDFYLPVGGVRAMI